MEIFNVFEKNAETDQKYEESDLIFEETGLRKPTIKIEILKKNGNVRFKNRRN